MCPFLKGHFSVESKGLSKSTVLPPIANTSQKILISDYYFFVFVGALGVLLYPIPNFWLLKRDRGKLTSAGRHQRGNETDRAASHISRHIVRLTCDTRSHTEAFASNIFSLFLVETAQTSQLTWNRPSPIAGDAPRLRRMRAKSR